MCTFLGKGREILDALVVKCGQASAPAACLFVVAFDDPVGVKVVFDDGKARTSGGANGLFHIFDLFVPARPSIGRIGKPAIIILPSFKPPAASCSIMERI